MLQVWNRLCKEVLLPDQPFELHQQLYAAAYANWHAAERGPAPVWQPDPLGAADTNLARFMAKFQVGCLKPHFRFQGFTEVTSF